MTTPRHPRPSAETPAALSLRGDRNEARWLCVPAGSFIPPLTALRTFGALWLALSACCAPSPLEPGELMPIAPDTVISFEYETPEFVLIAHRFSEREPFALFIQSIAETSVRHCRSDDAFGALLDRFAALRIRRRVSKPELLELKKAGRSYHRLRVAATAPMQAYEEILSPTPRGFLLLENQSFAYELSLSTRAVAQLGRSCDPAGAQNVWAK